ncbi:MAG: type II CAAX endopeptidase family protein [Clostridiales bacterium]
MSFCQKMIFISKDDQPQWQIYQAVLLFALANAVVLAFSFLYGIFLPKDVFLLNLLASFLQTAVFIGGSYFFVAYYHYRPWFFLGFRYGSWDKIFFSGISWGIMLYFVSVLSTLLLSLIIPRNNPQEIFLLLQACDNQLLLALFVFSIVILAPLGEEVLFRGFFYAALKKKLGVNPGIIISGICFGAVHLDPTAFLGFALAGMGLAYLYEKKGNLWYNIMAHIVFNSIGMILFLLTKNSMPV